MNLETIECPSCDGEATFDVGIEIRLISNNCEIDCPNNPRINPDALVAAMESELEARWDKRLEGKL